MFSSEWKQDSESMVKDGQYWRSVFGGARLVLGFIRMTSAAFVILRIVLCICMFVILGLELRAHPSNQDWMLTFGHWTLVLQCSYFVFGSLISLVAVCQDGAGFSHTTPTAVRLFEHMYGAIIPASWVAFGLAIVQYAQAKYCISHVDLHHAQPWLATVLSGSALAAVVIDIGFNRSPYYSSFHGLSGIGFCWGYLLFNFLWQELGGRNVHDQAYIYRCLDWYYPFVGGGHNAAGKLLILNLFVAIPLVNYIYWLLLWARRRVMLVGKPVPDERPMSTRQAGAQQQQQQQQQQQGGGRFEDALSPLAPGRRRLFEWQADWRDLALDGRHWRAQFGGSSSPRSPRVGAYVLCGPVGYCVTRVIIMLLTWTLLLFRLLGTYARPGVGDTLFPGVHAHTPRWYDFVLFLENWVLAISASYFTYACVLTLTACVYSGREAHHTPRVVWTAWALHGMLLPMAVVNACVYLLLSQGRANHNVAGPSAGRTAAFDYSCVWGTLFLVLFDGWINRQPYYATYHAFWGAGACWAYLLFNVLFVLGGGTDEYGRPYLYPSAAWKARTLEAWVHPGKIIFLELIILIPVGNCLYWCMLWARRRARVLIKHSQV